MTDKEAETMLVAALKLALFEQRHKGRPHVLHVSVIEKFYGGPPANYSKLLGTWHSRALRRRLGETKATFHYAKGCFHFLNIEKAHQPTRKEAT